MAHTLPRLVLATGNPHKVAEMRALFAGRVEIVGLAEAAAAARVVVSEPAETGTTFEENARIKAESYARQLGMVCLADDSGLEVDALGGKPGVISSHYCTDGREAGMTRAERDAANNARVLRQLEGVPAERRGARFVCVMCVAWPGATSKTGGVDGTSATPARVAPSARACPLMVRGTFEGRIGLPPRVPAGGNGFGYDPLFLVGPDFGRTGAELAPGEKNRLSHRAAAARLLLARLDEMMSTTRAGA